MKNTTFVAPADRLLTADQIATKLARLASARARRAEVRAAIREANRRLRAQLA